MLDQAILVFEFERLLTIYNWCIVRNLDTKCCGCNSHFDLILRIVAGIPQRKSIHAEPGGCG